MELSRRSRRLLTRALAVAIGGGGMVGAGILFDRYARQIPGHVYCSIVLGFVFVLGCVAREEAERAHGARRLLRPVGFVAASVTLLVLGVAASRTLTSMSYREEHVVVLGVLLIMASALWGTILGARGIHWKAVPKADAAIVVAVVSVVVWVFS